METFTNSKNIARYAFGRGAVRGLETLLAARRTTADDFVVFFVDAFFRGRLGSLAFPVRPQDLLVFVETALEPTTDLADHMTANVRKHSAKAPCCVVGMGGGITLDVAKAVANLLTNGGKAEDFQGWDLVKKPALYKIGIPTVSGTGAEASRTCVLMNEKKNLKLGMNSEFTLYDQLILDPDLTESVPKEQYFYTGMDTYIHCIESLAGSYRHPVGDAFSHEALRLVSEVFDSNEMMALANREKLMVASYLGGCAIANSYVGVVHPFSAGLSVVLGIHHCLANCLVMNQMQDYYPRETAHFKKMLKAQGITLPSDVCRGLSDGQMERLYQSTVIHERPLTNALGVHYKDTLTLRKVRELFQRI
ncbi:MAG: iron-containing alcohol dehydrogenase [Deltaproteobacteria bacterium]|nr:iron-containing alcohol dehydrogenase [Deltaproteobacteria bacterium]MBI3294168.1 iron-containing alcohol dehydrogenase [Deltaproteobacteria bacterium]